ncbi:MAG: asparagine synthase (glutamine-hydrolyzing) [Rhodopseudomonas sp.]|nr:asparagine synthase (glutamine-hydrolyzing) [Rhodopseudomonas sp.]
MCGIAAIVTMPGHAIDGNLVGLLDRKLAHRGPDASGAAFFRRDGLPGDTSQAAIALIHRRLSIIDLDARANQPMTSSDNRYDLVFNGEIYNYIELRQELQRAGYQFRTESDSEVLMTAYAAWGEKALTRFTGMFAFALLDRQKRELFIARDPFGIKPLFWTVGRDALAIASEIGPLLDVPGVSRNVNLARMSLYLSVGQTDAGDETMFADIFSLPAGSYARISLAGPQRPAPISYWRPRIERRERSLAVSAQELREAFLQSVGFHLRSDVPVGIALSGGIDSSAILGAVRAIAGQNQEIHAFSFIAAGSEVDETRFIDLAARAGNAVRHDVYIEPEDIVGDIDQLIALQGEPFGSLSIYAQQRVMQLAAANNIKVMLDGQGADELFAGYRPYVARRLSELLASGRLAEAAALIGAIRRMPQGGLRLVLQAFEAMTPRYLQDTARALIGRPLFSPWIEKAWFADRGALNAGPLPPRGPGFLHNALVQSLTDTVLPALLRYEDRNSMAVAIESRVPFLTPALADLAYSLPSDHLVDGNGTSKAVLRAAMRGLVPDEILDRKDKIGFATPDRQWAARLRPWFSKVLRSDTARASSWLRPDDALAALEGRSGKGVQFGFDVWRTVNFLRWVEVFNAKVV